MSKFGARNDFFHPFFSCSSKDASLQFFTSRLEQKQELGASERQFYSKGKNRMQLDFSSGKLIRKMIEAKIALVKFQNLLANGKTTTNKRTAKMESKLTRFYFKVLSVRGQNFFNSVELILISEILSSICQFSARNCFQGEPFPKFFICLFCN